MTVKDKLIPSRSVPTRGAREIDGVHNDGLLLLFMDGILIWWGKTAVRIFEVRWRVRTDGNAPTPMAGSR